MPRRSRDKSERQREIARLLRLDPDNLSEADRLRCQVVGILRGVLDTEEARIEAGSTVDATKAVAANEMLLKVAPEIFARPAAESGSRYVGDPAARLAQIILGAVRRAPQSGPVEPSPVAPPADEAAPAPTQPPPADTPLPDNVTPLFAQHDAKPDSPQPQPGPLSSLLDTTPADSKGGSAGFRIGPATEPWRQYVEPSDSGFFWGGEKGRSW